MSRDDFIDVAFIGHPSSFAHLVRMIEKADGPEAARRVSRNEKSFTAFLDWMPSAATHHRPVIQLRGTRIRAAMIVCWFLPQIIDNRQKLKAGIDKVLNAVEVAAGLGAKVAALGGFTSILAGQRRFDAADAAGITLTAGNALTAALAVARLRNELESLNRPLQDETVAIVGASGDVGSTVAALLGEQPRRLLLVARNQVRLERTRESLAHSDAVCVPLADAVAQASVIIAATSASEPILRADDIRPGAVVCDLGYPPTITSSTAGREAPRILQAGLARFPAPLGLGAYSRLARADHLYGCSSEGVVLAARPDLRHLARSQGESGEREAIALLDAAISLGLEPSAETADMPREQFAEREP